jgi:hypothetical protein
MIVEIELQADALRAVPAKVELHVNSGKFSKYPPGLETNVHNELKSTNPWIQRSIFCSAGWFARHGTASPVVTFQCSVEAGLFALRLSTVKRHSAGDDISGHVSGGWEKRGWR